MQRGALYTGWERSFRKQRDREERGAETRTEVVNAKEDVLLGVVRMGGQGSLSPLEVAWR
jgi:hypothetical protein